MRIVFIKFPYLKFLFSIFLLISITYVNRNNWSSMGRWDNCLLLYYLWRGALATCVVAPAMHTSHWLRIHHISININGVLYLCRIMKPFWRLIRSRGFLMPLTGLQFEDQLHILLLSIIFPPLYFMPVPRISYCCETDLLGLCCEIMLGNSNTR